MHTYTPDNEPLCLKKKNINEFNAGYFIMHLYFFTLGIIGKQQTGGKNYIKKLSFKGSLTLLL